MLPVILGPTASGKTKLAARLAFETGSEIISADSRQVYREMNIGTGKDLQDYQVEGKRVPYHLIDIKEPGERYHIHEFRQDFESALNDIRGRGKQAILCGGTGLYIESVLKDFRYTAIPVDHQLRASLEDHSRENLQDIFSSMHSVYHSLADTSTKKRLIRAIEIATYLQSNPQPLKESTGLEYKVFGIFIAADERRRRIDERLEKRLDTGMLAEVQGLLDKGLKPAELMYYGLEYKLITEHLTGQYDLDTLRSKLRIAIHQYSKRQMTYFRKMEKGGIVIHWLDGMKDQQVMVGEIKKEMGWNLENLDK